MEQEMKEYSCYDNDNNKEMPDGHIVIMSGSTNLLRFISETMESGWHCLVEQRYTTNLGFIEKLEDSKYYFSNWGESYKDYIGDIVDLERLIEENIKNDDYIYHIFKDQRKMDLFAKSLASSLVFTVKDVEKMDENFINKDGSINISKIADHRIVSTENVEEIVNLIYNEKYIYLVEDNDSDTKIFLLEHEHNGLFLLKEILKNKIRTFMYIFSTIDLAKYVKEHLQQKHWLCNVFNNKENAIEYTKNKYPLEYEKMEQKIAEQMEIPYRECAIKFMETDIDECTTGEMIQWKCNAKNMNMYTQLSESGAKKDELYNVLKEIRNAAKCGQYTIGGLHFKFEEYMFEELRKMGYKVDYGPSNDENPHNIRITWHNPNIEVKDIEKTNEEKIQPN